MDNNNFMQEGLFSQASDMTNNFIKLANSYGLDSLAGGNNQSTGDPGMDYYKSMQSGEFSNPYQAAAPMSIDIHNPEYNNQFVDRYKALNAFEDYGFNPFRDNEKLYNEVASGWDNFQRAFGSFIDLTAAAAVDSATWGVFSDNTAEQFKISNAIGQSTKGGVGGFMTNLFINSGYTIGILGEIAAEEILATFAAAGISTLTGGLGAAAGAAELGAVTGRNVGRMRTLYETIKTQNRLLNQMHRVSESKTFADVLKNVGVGTAHLINPFENTMQSFNNIRKLEEAGETVARSKKIQSATLGLWSDVITAKSAMTESLMEGNFAEDEMKWKMLNNFKDANGRLPNEQETYEMMKNIKAANYATAMANMPLIYVTNKMTFGLFARPIESLGKNFIRYGGTELIREFDKETAKNIVKKMGTGFVERHLELLKHPKLLLKDTLIYSQDNFFEGFQELSQDIISGTAKEYYTDNFNNAIRGSWYDYLLSNMGDQMSRKGLETFMSGFLMQKLISPIVKVGGRIVKGDTYDDGTISGKIVSKASDAIDYVVSGKEKHAENVKAREEKQKQMETKLNEDIELLQDAFNADPSLYFNDHFENLISADRLQKLMKDDGVPEEMKEEYTRRHLEKCYITALKYGQFDGVIETLNQYKTMSAEDLKSVWGQERTDEFLKNVDNAIIKAKDVQSAYNYVTSTYEIPYSVYDINNADEETAKRMKKANLAYYDVVKNYIMQNSDYEAEIKRQREILNKLNGMDKSRFKGAPYEVFTPLFGYQTMKDRRDDIVRILYGLDGKSGLMSLNQSQLDEKTEKEIKNLKDEYTALGKLSQAVDEFLKKDNLTEDNINSLVDSITEYIKNINSSYDLNVNTTDTNLNELVDLLANNFYSIYKSNDYSRSIALLSDPNMFKRYVNYINAERTFFASQKDKEIEESLRKFREKKENDKFLNELYEAGVFINEKDLENLDKNNVMPEVYDLATNKKLSYFDDKYKRAYQIISNKYPNVHDIPIENAKIEQSRGTTIKGQAFTYKDLINRFGGLEGAGGKLLLDKEYKLADVVNYMLGLNGVLDREAKFLKEAVKALENQTIKFVDDQQQALTVVNDKVLIDLRYFSKDYAGSNSRLEFGILKAVVNTLLIDELNNNKKFRDEIEDMRKETINYFDKLSPEEKKKYYDAEAHFGLIDDMNFCVEAMCNRGFQKLLSQVKGKGNKSDNVFREFIKTVFKTIKNIIKPVDSNLLDDSLSLITDAINDKLNKNGNPAKEATVNTGQTTGPLDVNDSREKIKSYPDVVLKELADKFTDYSTLILERDENEFKGKSPMEIVDMPDFPEWYKNSDIADKIRNKYNAKFPNSEYNNKTFNLTEALFVDDFSGIQKNQWDKYNTASQLMKFIVAMKMMKPVGNALTKEMSEVYNKYKSEIDNIIAVHNGSSEFKLNGKKLSQEQLKGYLIDKLGYNKSQIDSMTTDVLEQLAVDGITVSDRIKLSNEKLGDIQTRDFDYVDNVRERFSNCRTQKELYDEYNLQKKSLLDSYAKDEPLFVSLNELMNIYITYKNKLKEASKQNEYRKKISLLGTVGRIFAFPGENKVYLVNNVDVTDNDAIVTIVDTESFTNIKTYNILELADKVNINDILSDDMLEVPIELDEEKVSDEENIKHNSASNSKTLTNLGEEISENELDRILNENCK